MTELSGPLILIAFIAGIAAGASLATLIRERRPEPVKRIDPADWWKTGAAPRDWSPEDN